MKKPRATAMTCVVLALGGLATGCETDSLGEVVREALAAGFRTEVEKIPGLILGLANDDDDTALDDTSND